MIGVGPWSNIQWMSQKEYWQRQRHPEYFEGETLTEEDLTKGKESGKLSKIVDAIVEFLEEVKDPITNIAKTVPVPDREGFYEGLEDNLRFAGIKLKRVAPHHITQAWNKFRGLHPPFPKTNGVNYRYISKDTDIEEVKPEKVEEDKPKRKRNTLLGFNVSSVIRRLSREGMVFDDVKKIMRHYGIDCMDTTITGQLWCGLQSSKRYGDRAKLTEEQINTLFEVLSK